MKLTKFIMLKTINTIQQDICYIVCRISSFKPYSLPILLCAAGTEVWNVVWMTQENSFMFQQAGHCSSTKGSYSQMFLLEKLPLTNVHKILPLPHDNYVRSLAILNQRHTAYIALNTWLGSTKQPVSVWSNYHASTSTFFTLNSEKLHTSNT